MRRNREHNEVSGDGWLLTLNDLLFLLLTFFVLLFATLDFGTPAQIQQAPQSLSADSISSFENARVLMESVLDESSESSDRHREATFRDGAKIKNIPEGLSLELPQPFLDDELSFRTAALLRVAERLAAERGFFIELQAFSQKNAAQQLIRCGRQILDAGFPGERISGYGREVSPGGEQELLVVLLRPQNKLS